MIDFVYVWINTGAQSVHELTMSLRSLEENVCGSYRVFVVGDCPPGRGNLIYVPHTRERSGKGSKALDAVNKMRVILDTAHIGERFVYMSDDEVLLQPCTVEMLEQIVAVHELTPENTKGKTRHQVLIGQTFRALGAGLSQRVWNYETHMPRVFEKAKMRAVLDRFKPSDDLLLPTLYFNMHYRNVEPAVMSQFNGYLARFVGVEDMDLRSIQPAPTEDRAQAKAYYLRNMVGRRFANWTDTALCQGLVDALGQHFPKASSHEKSDRAYVIPQA